MLSSFVSNSLKIGKFLLFTARKTLEEPSIWILFLLNPSNWLASEGWSDINKGDGVNLLSMWVSWGRVRGVGE